MTITDVPAAIAVVLKVGSYRPQFFLCQGFACREEGGQLTLHLISTETRLWR